MGLAIILCAGIIQRQLYPDMFLLSWKVYFGGLGQPLLGYGLGMTLGAISRRNIKEMRTIAYETGMQNVGLALTIISLSYTGLQRNYLSQYPLIYAIGQMVVGIGAVIIHRIVFAVRDKKCKRYDFEEEKLEKEISIDGGTFALSQEDIANGNVPTVTDYNGLKKPLDSLNKI